jgi:hypothetical protein
MFLRLATCAGGLQKMADWRDELVEIAECEFCDENGIRPGGQRCDHIDYATIAKRGIAKVREALNRG